MTVKEAKDLLIEVKPIQNLGGYTYSIAIADAIKKLKTEVNRIENLRKKDKEFQKFEKEREELFIKYSKKQEDGNPIIEWFTINGEQKGKYVFDETKKDAIDKEFKILINKYEKIIVLQQNKENNYIEGMQQELVFKKIEIKEKFIPKHLPTYIRDKDNNIIYDEIQPNHIILICKLLNIITDEKPNIK